MLRDGLTGDWIGTFIGHKGAVWSSRLSSDASLAITGSADFSARVWDTFSGACTAELEHAHIVRAVAMPGQGTDRCATGGMERRVRVWDLNRVGESQGRVNGDEGRSLEVGKGLHGGAVKSIIWDRRDGNVLTTAADDKMLRWFDLRQPERPIATHAVDGLIGSCELNDALDGMTDGCMSVAAGKGVYFFDAARPGSLVKKVGMEKEVASVAVSAAGGVRRFVTGGAGDTWVHVWDYDTGAELGMYTSISRLQGKGAKTNISQKQAKATTARSGRSASHQTASCTRRAAKTEPSSYGKRPESHMDSGDERISGVRTIHHAQISCDTWLRSILFSRKETCVAHRQILGFKGVKKRRNTLAWSLHQGLGHQRGV